MYIVLEGVVGTGKSTQSQLLHTYLQEQFPDKQVVLVREPGGSEIAEAIRNLVQATPFEEVMHPLTDAYLYAAARAQLLHGTVKPILDAGGIVVSDRSFCTGLSYQGYTQGLGMDLVWKINKPVVQDVFPDLVLFMDMDVATGLARTFDADGDKREKEDTGFFVQAYVGYTLLADYPITKDVRRVIDAHGSREEVFGRIQKTIDTYLSR